jgi:hypothetical protein
MPSASVTTTVAASPLDRRACARRFASRPSAAHASIHRPYQTRRIDSRAAGCIELSQGVQPGGFRILAALDPILTLRAR